MGITHGTGIRIEMMALKVATLFSLDFLQVKAKLTMEQLNSIMH